MKTPVFDLENIDTLNISQSVFYKEIPMFYLDGMEFLIWINFNYVVSGIAIEKHFGSPLFILKKEMVDLIGNRYANHVSRIGITSF